MKTENSCRRSSGFISTALLASVLALGSSILSVLDWYQGQRERRESERIEQLREERVQRLEADVEKLQLQIASATAAPARPSLGSVSRQDVDRGTGVAEPPRRGVERLATPASGLLKNRVDKAREDAEGKGEHDK